MTQPLLHQGHHAHGKPTPAPHDKVALPRHILATKHGLRALGRLPRREGVHLPHYAGKRTSVAYTYPDAVHYYDKCPDNMGMMLNGEDPSNPDALVIGDCTCAADGHMIQVWSVNVTGACVTVPDASVLQLYEGACGYVEGDPNTDQGGNEVDVLTYLTKTGMITPTGTHKILGFYDADVSNFDQLRQAIYECGNVYIGVNLPQAWEQCVPGDTLDAVGSPVAGGHAGILCGYDKAAKTFDLVWWGMKLKVTEAGLTQALEEAYPVVSADWIEKTGLSPQGKSVVQIQKDMTTITGQTAGATV